MKHLFVLAVLVICLSAVSKAQGDFTSSRIWADQYPTQNAYGHKKLTLNDVQGSPYLDNEYKKGTVITDDGQIYKDIPLRYNCFYDVLEFQKDGSPYDLMPKERAQRAEFGGQVFKYLTYEPGTEKNRGYFVILTEGKASLCSRYIINFYDQEPLKAYAESKPARFDDLLETFWVSIDDAPAKKILNNKKLIEILGDKKAEIQSFMSKQKLSVKKVDDLKKIINYYNTL